MRHGYHQREGLKRFQLVRKVPANDGGAAIGVIVDFLMPRHADIVKNIPPLIDNFAVQRADGADLATRFYQLVAISGAMPDGGSNKVEVAVCSIPALLAMKGHALNGRLKTKDAYDIYYCVRNYPDGIAALAGDCMPLLEHASGVAGFQYVAAKFDEVDSYGPTSVRKFVEDSRILGDRTPDQWQRDAFGQVDALVREMKLRV